MLFPCILYALSLSIFNDFLLKLETTETYGYMYMQLCVAIVIALTVVVVVVVFFVIIHIYFPLFFCGNCATGITYSQ